VIEGHLTVTMGEMTSGSKQDRLVQRNLHGRRVGRPLTPAQSNLLARRMPAIRLDLSGQPPERPDELFPATVNDVWLEIGFGAGEHLLWQARAHPRIGLIGCEPFLNGVVKVVRGMEQSGLQNIRLYDDDALHLLSWLPDQGIGRLFVLFPDPWPKKRHRKRRFLTEHGLAMLARVLRSGAQLRFATDIDDYAEMVLEGVRQNGAFHDQPGELTQRPDDWPLTRYGEKAKAAGRACRFFIFERR